MHTHHPSARPLPSRTARRAGPRAALAALALLLAAPGVGAHGSEEHGTLTFHDTADGPDARSLSCEFWVRGTGMSHQEGTLHVAHDLGGPGAHSHTLAAWNGTPDGDGTYSFEVGPLTIHEDDDDTDITGFMDGMGHKTAGYWVEYEACDEDDDEKDDERDEEEKDEDDDKDGRGGLGVDLCATVLLAEAEDDGSVRVHARGLATDAVLLRATGDGEFKQVAKLDADGAVFVDEQTREGTTYTYRLLVDGDPCASVEVTAIPVFPTALAGGLAATAGLVGYAALRRRP